DVPRLSETGVDLRVLVFAFSISLLASLLFGLAPALQALRIDLNHALKQSTSRSFGGSVADRMRSALVVAEIAFSVILLAGAGLLIKSFVALQNASLGFRPEKVLVMSASFPVHTSMTFPPPPEDIASQRRATRFYKELLTEIVTLPG